MPCYRFVTSLLVDSILIAGDAAILTPPLAVPFTIALWMVAAALGVPALFGRPREETEERR